MLSEARQKKIMEKLNRAQKCSILGPQNLGSGGARAPRPPWIRTWIPILYLKCLHKSSITSSNLRKKIQERPLVLWQTETLSVVSRARRLIFSLWCLYACLVNCGQLHTFLNLQNFIGFQKCQKQNVLQDILSNFYFLDPYVSLNLVFLITT